MIDMEQYLRIAREVGARQGWVLLYDSYSSSHPYRIALLRNIELETACTLAQAAGIPCNDQGYITDTAGNLAEGALLLQPYLAISRTPEPEPEAVCGWGLEVRCPECRKWDRLSTVETLTGICGITNVESDGSFDWDAQGVEIDWSSQITERDEQGVPKLHCGHCGHEWFETQLQPLT